MEVLKNKTDTELLKSTLAEIAKTQNEIKCAQGDLNKALSRQTFLIALINELISREED
jgi:hypothetical protein